MGKSDEFQLADTTTGALVHALRCGSRIWNTPNFSPDGKFVAVDGNYSYGVIQVFDTASGQKRFQADGWSPQFLPGDSLLGLRTPDRPEIAVWSSDGRTQMRVFPYDLGASPLSGSVYPHPWPTGRPNQFGLIYDTADGWWTGSSKSSGMSSSGLGRSLRLNIPRGLGLDVVDSVAGKTKTYHLDGSVTGRWYPFPKAGKILIPKPGVTVNPVKPMLFRQFGETVAVWDIPPRRTYVGVWAMAGIMAAIGILGYALGLVVRCVARRYRGKQQVA
jgi:hypothetical protein